MSECDILWPGGVADGEVHRLGVRVVEAGDVHREAVARSQGAEAFVSWLGPQAVKREERCDPDAPLAHVPAVRLVSVGEEEGVRVGGGKVGSAGRGVRVRGRRRLKGGEGRCEKGACGVLSGVSGVVEAPHWLDALDARGLGLHHDGIHVAPHSARDGEVVLACGTVIQCRPRQINVGAGFRPFSWQICTRPTPQMMIAGICVGDATCLIKRAYAGWA